MARKRRFPDRGQAGPRSRSRRSRRRTQADPPARTRGGVSGSVRDGRPPGGARIANRLDQPVRRVAQPGDRPRPRTPAFCASSSQHAGGDQGRSASTNRGDDRAESGPSGVYFPWLAPLMLTDVPRRPVLVGGRGPPVRMAAGAAALRREGQRRTMRAPRLAMAVASVQRPHAADQGKPTQGRFATRQKVHGRGRFVSICAVHEGTESMFMAGSGRPVTPRPAIVCDIISRFFVDNFGEARWRRASLRTRHGVSHPRRRRPGPPRPAPAFRFQAGHLPQARR